jgi:hypothetical protein
VVPLHGPHGRDTQGGDADPANDVPTSRLRIHNDHYVTKSIKWNVAVTEFVADWYFAPDDHGRCVQLDIGGALSSLP